MKKESLAGRVYLNTKHIVALLGGILIIGGAIYRYQYMEDDEVNTQTYQSELLQTVSSTLVASIMVGKHESIAISESDEKYLSGYQKLESCGKTKFKLSQIWNKDEKYKSYNRLLNNLIAVNQSLYALKIEGDLSRDYHLPLHLVLETVCQDGMDIRHVSNALNKLSAKRDLAGLNWTEDRMRKYDANIHGAVSLPISWHAKKNPWRGLDGCVYMANTQPITTKEGTLTNVSLIGLNYHSELHKQVCQTPDMYHQAKVVFPINQEKAEEHIIPLADYQSKDMLDHFSAFMPLLDSATSVRKDSAYFVEVDGNDVPVGFNAQLTINPNMQIFTRQLAECFTGKLDLSHPVCKNLSSKITQDMLQLESKALARQVGIAIIDVPSGRVDVATGSTSHCFDKNFGIVSKNIQCFHDIPNSWKGMMTTNQAKENPALYAHYMPASTIKPIQALAMVRAFPEAVKQNHDYISSIMAQSLTEPVIDILTCNSSVSKRYINDCQGFAKMQQSANDLSWNNECFGTDCGKQDILYGQKLHHTQVQTPLFYGRLLTDDSGNYLAEGLGDISKEAYTNATQGLGMKNGGYDWSKLKKTSSQALAIAVQESYGQRNARATPLGVASAMRTLLVSASTNSFRPTHLVEHLWTAGNNQVLFEVKENPQQIIDDTTVLPLSDNQQKTTSAIAQTEAQTAISFFTKSHYVDNGTARGACRIVFEGQACTINQPNPLGYQIFSKTGTATFNTTWSNIKKLKSTCEKPVLDKEKDSKPDECHLRPIKWFVLGVGKNNQWSKVIVVMSESNWDSSGDIKTDHIASKIGFNIMKLLGEANMLEGIELKGN